MIPHARIVSVGALCAATVLLFAATPKPKVTPTPPPVPVATRVAYFLKYAPTNFAQIRGKLLKTNKYDYAQYELLPIVTPICHTCHIYDTYANSQYKEAWAVGWTWYFAKKKTADEMAADIIARLTPLLKGYKMTRGVADGSVWVSWDAPNNTWVYFQTGGGNEDPNVRIRVGHSLLKAAHVVKPTNVTEAEKTAIATALTSIIKLATSDGPNNYASLRGEKSSPSTFKAGEFETYNCAAMFPPLIGCEITGLLNYEYAKWMFEFKTPSIGGTPEAARAFIHSVVVNALPSGYTIGTPDVASLISPDDYQWNGPSSMQITYKSSVEDGKTSFEFIIWHFLQ